KCYGQILTTHPLCLLNYCLFTPSLSKTGYPSASSIIDRAYYSIKSIPSVASPTASSHGLPASYTITAEISSLRRLIIAATLIKNSARSLCVQRFHDL